MSTFAPRERMPARCCVGAKTHFNIFTIWDVGFHALGLKEWDLPLAKENLTTLLASQRRDGSIVYAIGPDLRPFVPLLEGVSQPPVPAIAVREVFERDGARDRTWLAACYVRLRRWARWWESARLCEGGLFSWRNALETGWDDTPRFPNPRVPPVGPLSLGNLSGLASARHVAAVDLNAWMFAFYESLEAIARHLGRAEEASGFGARARGLAERVEERLWDDERGGYFDREIAPNGGPGAFRRALTPAVAWPLFVGIATRRERVKRLVEGLLLDPRKLFGDPEDRADPRFPVPSVAFDDPSYGHEERGYYWRGQVWMAPSYAVLAALWRAGYDAEAERLRARLLALLAGACEGGLFEAYDARSGGIGQGSGSISGPGEPACFQIGLTTAIAALVVLRAYERYPRLALA
jgi:putative isomerase